jgi:hypothetical protein
MNPVITQPRTAVPHNTTPEAVSAAWTQLVERYHHKAVLALDTHLPADTGQGQVCLACQASWPCPAVLAAMLALEL